ncbi:1-8-cineole synthase 2 [Nymphaea thermarum]|nr:1-8-cineole synthase 2 [Nymphaea thermarum]
MVHGLAKIRQPSVCIRLDREPPFITSRCPLPTVRSPLQALAIDGRKKVYRRGKKESPDGKGSDNETRAVEEQAQQHIRELLMDAWRRLNREMLSAQQQQQQTAFSRSFMSVSLNIARVSQCMYNYEDGVGVLEHESMDRAYSLIAEPIQTA